MILNKLVEMIEFEDLTDSNKYIAELIGMDLYKQMVLQFYGESLYIQDPRHNKKTIKRYINNNPNKPKYMIAKELGKNTRFISKLASERDN